MTAERSGQRARQLRAKGTAASAAQPLEHNASDPERLAGFARIIAAGYRPYAVVINGHLEMVWYQEGPNLNTAS